MSRFRAHALMVVSVSIIPVVFVTGAAPRACAQGESGTVHTAQLWFDADASLGAFRGITKTAHGEMHGGPALALVRGFVEAPSASLSTDNSIRDHDMRKTLDVDKYPAIRFDLDSVAVTAEAGDSTRVELLGRMAIHGVTKRVRIPSVVRRQGTLVHVTGAIDIHLPDYGITSLKRMLGTLSMKPDIKVGLDVTFTTLTKAHEGSED